MTQISEVHTLRGWQGNQLSVTEYRTRHYDKGNSVTTVNERLYSVQLYSAQGQQKQYSSKGQHVDLTV